MTKPGSLDMSCGRVRAAGGVAVVTAHERMGKPVACPAFQWIGQSWASCDNCGKPFWEHTHETVSADGKPFGHLKRRVIPRSVRENVAKRYRSWPTW